MSITKRIWHFVLRHLPKIIRDTLKADGSNAVADEITNAEDHR